jgi:hypothetical protein
MKKTIFIAMMLIGMMGSAQVSGVEVENNYIFYFGMKDNVWNKNIFEKNVTFYSLPSQSNEIIYNEALNVLNKNNKTFEDFIESEFYAEDSTSINDLIYNRGLFFLNNKLKRTFDLGNSIMVVYMSNTISNINIYIKE